MRFKKELINQDNGFLVQLAFIVFYILERISVFYWLRVLGTYIHQKRYPDSNSKPFVKSYIFPEIWVVGNIIFAILAVQITKLTHNTFLLWLFAIYSLERVLEMFVYQVNVLFFHRLNTLFLEPRKVKEKPQNKTEKKAENTNTNSESEIYMIKSSTRTVIMLILNMVEYVLQFSVAFASVSILCQYTGEAVSIMGSFEIFMNLKTPEDFLTNKFLMLAYAETLIGMFMNLICLARFVGMLPEVAERGIKLPEEKSQKN